MNKNTKQALGAVAIVVILALLYKQYKKKQTAALPASTTTDANSSNFAPTPTGRWIVGAYNAATNTTYIFPEGNVNGGKSVRGSIGAPVGTPFYPSSAV